MKACLHYIWWFVDVLTNNTYLNRLNLEFDQISPWEFHYPREPKDLSKRMSSAFKKLYFNNQLVSNNTEKQLGEVVSLIPKPSIIHMVKALSMVKDDNNHSMAVLYHCCWKCFFLLSKQSKTTTHKKPSVTAQGRYAFVNFNIWLNLGIFHNISINGITQAILWVSQESNFMGV